MSAKFKYGDKVLAGQHGGTIVSIKTKNNGYTCMVKFDDINLIPPEMSYDEGYLLFKNSDEDICPICGDRWQVSKFNMHVWKDCKQCGLTSEDCVKKYADSKQSGLNLNSSDKKKDGELLDEFEKMLDNKVDDDKDDFVGYIWGA